jgi:hypothetical protein
MNRALEKFINMHVPGKGYHAQNGQIELFSEKNLSFQCGCGSTHRVNDSFAIIDFPLENKGVYVCPSSDGIFSLVKATGLMSVKGLKTIGFYKASNEAEKREILLGLESRKKCG